MEGGGQDQRGRRWYLEGLQEGVEVDEDDPGDLVLPGVDKEQHVGDAQEGEQYQSGLHSLPGGGQGSQSHSPPQRGLGWESVPHV